MVSNKLIKVQKYDRTEFEGYGTEKHFMMAYKLFSLNSENHSDDRTQRSNNYF